MVSSGSETATVAFAARLDDDDDGDDLGGDDDSAIWTGTMCRENLEYELTCRPRLVETGIKAKTETFWIWNWPSKAKNAQRIFHTDSNKGPDLVVLDVL
jgi:hypothetical protein